MIIAIIAIVAITADIFKMQYNFALSIIFMVSFKLFLLQGLAGWECCRGRQEVGRGVWGAGRLCGHESLLCWNHQDRGYHGDSTFVLEVTIHSQQGGNFLISKFFGNWQEILEKFEFFPIKCKIQRAKDTYAKFVELLNHNSRQFKSKVCVV
jgi:hypothetical protein